jgi:hypothetical protein
MKRRPPNYVDVARNNAIGAYVEANEGLTIDQIASYFGLSRDIIKNTLAKYFPHLRYQARRKQKPQEAKPRLPRLVHDPIKQEKYALARKLRGFLEGEMHERQSVLVKGKTAEFIVTVTTVGGNKRYGKPTPRRFLDHNYDVRHGRKQGAIIT